MIALIHVSSEVLAALVGLVGTILTILNARMPARVEKRIRGLINGKKTQALAEIDRLYQDRRSRGLPLRREVDRIVEKEQEP
jgi:hypothetical protein